ncbi:MAG: T9SS type A sorting domain-containing protein [Chitinophagales bacterium]|nr:T9SS type A sorting domain-containing protein [Bacteroidota bacterium]MCB9043350.1 T9SS type A sorting domain-containing protein [Chitinophagales bacterium]
MLVIFNLKLCYNKSIFVLIFSVLILVPAVLMGQCDTPEDDCVWPGDTNKDGIVNNFDVFNLGIAYGSTGSAREQFGVYEPFQAYAGDDWADNFIDGVNYKHADCKGEGAVESIDIDVIAEYYELTTGKTKGANYSGVSLCIPPLENPMSQTLYNVDVVLGNAQIPADNIYGIAFSIYFPTDRIDSIDFFIWDEAWFYTDLGVDYLKLIKIFEDEGRIDAALARTNQMGVSGFGTIATIELVTIDNISGQPITFEIANVRAIYADGSDFAISVCPENQNEVIGLEDNFAPQQFLYYPNPCEQRIYLHQPEKLRQLFLYDISGKKQPLSFSKNGEVFLENVPSGAYLLEVHTTAGDFFVEKVMVQ